MVQDGVDGLVFRAGDVEDCAEKLRQLTLGTAAEDMGRNAYERYWKRPLTIELHVAELERIYAEMLG